jgi:recombination protein RecA
MASKEDTSLEGTLKKITAAFGEGSIMRLGDTEPKPIEVISTGIAELDEALGVSGFPRGRIIEITGPESCLAGDTFVQYSTKVGDKCINNKGGTIEKLYLRFHGLPRSGRGNYQRPHTIDANFYAPSVNEEGRIFSNKIEDVFKTGIKTVYRLTTVNGLSVEATAEHKFFTGDDYVSLSELSEGDVIQTHTNTPYRVDIPYNKKGNPEGPQWYVKSHGTGPTKTIKGNGNEYVYYRIPVSRGIMEAYINGLSPHEYKEKLNSGDISGLIFLPSNVHVHHKEENYLNDDLSNLTVLSSEEHGRVHASERHNNLRFTIVSDKIESLVKVGEVETYDIRMTSPFNNYVANKIVVHNSGKSTIALHLVAEAQAAGYTCAYMDAEYALDPAYAKALGVDWDSLLLSQPDNAEQFLSITQMLAESGNVGVIVIDSVSALVPRAEVEGDMGDANIGIMAKLMSQALRKIVSGVSKSGTIVVFINQLRDKIGVFGYGPKEVTSGGRALKFYSSVRLDIRKIEQLKRGEEVIGHRARVKVVKNKVSPPFRVAEFDIVYGLGAAKGSSLFNRAVEAGVLQKNGNWYYLEGETFSNGAPAGKQKLNEDKEAYALIESRLKEVSGE